MFKHSTKIVAAVAGVAMLAAPFMSVGSAMAAGEIPQYADLSHVSLYETSSQKEVVNLLKASFDSGNGTATVYAQDFSNSNTFALGIRGFNWPMIAKCNHWLFCCHFWYTETWLVVGG